MQINSKVDLFKEEVMWYYDDQALLVHASKFPHTLMFWKDHEQTFAIKSLTIQRKLLKRAENKWNCLSFVEVVTGLEA